jgi:hypothetical protein
MANATRSEKLDLRLTPEAKRVLNAAAQASRRSVSEFVLESALDRAQEALPDIATADRLSGATRPSRPKLQPNFRELEDSGTVRGAAIRMGSCVNQNECWRI